MSQTIKRNETIVEAVRRVCSQMPAEPVRIPKPVMLEQHKAKKELEATLNKAKKKLSAIERGEKSNDRKEKNRRNGMRRR